MKRDMILTYQPGDIVLYNNQVHRVESFTSFFGVNLSDNINDVFVGDIKPIELTEEILSSLHFEESKFLQCMFFKLQDVKITVQIEKQYLICQVKQLKCTNHKIKYVHELCRALMYCNIYELFDLLNSVKSVYEKI